MAVPRRPIPTRTCVVCRTIRPKRELVRIVRTPTGAVVLDATGRLAGRGAYVCSSGACREDAIEKGVLARALRTALSAKTRVALARAARLSTTNEQQPEEATIGQE